MIKFYDSQITDVLPEVLKQKPEVQALSYALQQANQQVLKCLKNIELFYSIDSLPEPILDLLAVEWQTLNYRQDHSIDVKRTLIKNTFIWHNKMGTASVMEEYLKSVYGGGTVQEWFEYDGEPYHFRIDVDMTGMGIEVGQHKEVIKQIEQYKNARSQLDELLYSNTLTHALVMKMQSEVTFYFCFNPLHSDVPNYFDGSSNFDGSYLFGGYKTNQVIDQYPVSLGLDLKSGGELQTESKIHLEDSCSTNVSYQGNLTITGKGSSLISEESVLEGRGKEGISATETGRIHLTGGNRVDFDYTGQFEVNGETSSQAKEGSLLELQQKVELITQVETELVIEHNLWFFDGSYCFDGSRFFNAEITKEQL